MLETASGVFLESVWSWALRGVLIGTVLVLFLTALKRAISLINHPISKDFSVCAYWILAAGGLIASAGIFHLGARNAHELLPTLSFSAGALLPFGWFHRPFRIKKRPPPYTAQITSPEEPLQGQLLTTTERRVQTEPKPLAIPAHSGWESIGRDVHVLVSAVLYCACLCFTGFYEGENLDPQPSVSLLMTGFLGLLAGQLGWLANPGILIAGVFAHYRAFSASLALACLGVALQFLFTHRLPQGSSGNYVTITGYGWGYYLWVSALAVLALGQFARLCKMGPWVAILLWGAWLGITAPWFSGYFRPIGESITRLHEAREHAFAEKCATATEHIYRKVSGPIGGVYISPDFGEHASVQGNHVSSFGGGRQAEAYLGYPEVGYIEVDSNDASSGPKVTAPYLRMFPHHLGDQAVTQLASHYSYSRSRFSFPETYGLEGATITVTDLSDHSIVATTSYVYDSQKFRFCGAVQNGSFSAWGFLYRVLGLSK